MVLINAIGFRDSDCQFGIIAMINSIELLLGQVAAYLDDLSARVSKFMFCSDFIANVCKQYNQRASFSVFCILKLLSLNNKNYMLVHKK
jgi:hypothetical protein